MTDYFSAQITDQQMDEMRKQLALIGEVLPYDKYLAAYHFLQPHLINSDNYNDLLERRNKAKIKQSSELNHGTPEKRKISSHKIPVKTFEEKCDIMLMEMENGQFTCLETINPKQAAYLRKYMEENKCEESITQEPIWYKIYSKLESFIISKTANSAKQIKKRCEQFDLLSEAHGFRGLPAKELFSPSHTFVFYNVKYNQLITATVGDPINRWKGQVTLVGDIQSISVRPKLLPDLLTARSLKTMQTIFPNRKKQLLPALRMRPTLILLKKFKN